MAGDNAYKVTLFFPLQDNDGKEFEMEIWRWWRREITTMLKGFTDLGVVDGWWLGHSDQNYWIVAIVKTEQEVNQIRDFLRRAREKFKQEKMYLDYHPTHYEEVV